MSRHVNGKDAGDESPSTQVQTEPLPVSYLPSPHWLLGVAHMAKPSIRSRPVSPPLQNCREQGTDIGMVETLR